MLILKTLLKPLINKYSENLFLAFYYYEKLYWFFLHKILFYFLNIFIAYGLTIQLFLLSCFFHSIDFNFIRFYFSYQIFFTMYRLTIKLLLTLSQIQWYFSSNLLSFIKKDIYLVSLKFLLYTFIFGSMIHKGIFLSESSLYPIKFIGSFLPKGT